MSTIPSPLMSALGLKFGFGGLEPNAPASLIASKMSTKPSRLMSPGIVTRTVPSVSVLSSVFVSPATVSAVALIV